MPTPIIMPKVDMVMEKGTFGEWLLKEGEAVEKGQGLFVIYTDKASIEVEAPDSGVLSNLAAQPNDEIPISTVIGYIVHVGETLPTAAPALEPAASPTFEPTPQPVETHATPGEIPGDASVRATPLARNLARELQLDLRQVPGSGPRGRIHRADVERFAEHAKPLVDTLPERTSPIDLPLPAARLKTRVTLKGAQKIIAERMAFSSSTIPHILFSLDVDMSEASRMRQKLHASYQQRLGFGLSFTAIIARAVVTALQLHPSLNSSFAGGDVYLWESVHLGIATEVEENLVVPALREAQTMSLEAMASEIHALVEKARSKKLLPTEMTGSTFTLSNLGMIGVKHFTALINPPETAILAVGKIIDQPVVVDQAIVSRPMMNLNLAVDHRVTNGAQAARFLADLQDILENPYRML
jgi:pyruvate dehydrogenase E2 component (dihydrolipoamide acetyltransferase)